MPWRSLFQIVQRSSLLPRPLKPYSLHPPLINHKIIRKQIRRLPLPQRASRTRSHKIHILLRSTLRLLHHLPHWRFISIKSTSSCRAGHGCIWVNPAYSYKYLLGKYYWFFFAAFRYYYSVQFDLHLYH